MRTGNFSDLLRPNICYKTPVQIVNPTYEESQIRLAIAGQRMDGQYYAIDADLIPALC